MEITNVIGEKYRKLFIKNNTIFFVKHIKVKITYLKILTFYNCCYINKIELKLKYKSLKKL